VKVRVWERGAESGEVVAPYPQRLVLTALGGSVGTPPDGIEAEVVEAASLEAFDAFVARGGSVQGKIVFFNQRMARTQDMKGYAKAVGVRSHAASRAAKHGGVAALIRSIGTSRARFPHTGAMFYTPGIAKIPAAALANADADLLERIVREGKPVRVRLSLSCGWRGEADSANVVGEIPGREKPDEVVLLGAHLDSWDLGTGALDDGAGVGIVIEAARLVGELPRKPRRTIRVVLFANEELGLRGAKAYAEAHASELARHVAAVEVDSGDGRPLGLAWNAGPAAEPALREVARLLEPIGAGALKLARFGGADISRLIPAGVPVIGLWQDGTRYFDYHHTADDTYDKIDPKSLDAAVAAVAVLAYALAEMPEPLARIPAEKRVLPTW
jgi:Zn-dependent M28 family amino/carboxypeptidase